MPLQQLELDRARHLRRQPLTYADVGATAGTPPRDYHHFSRTHTLPANRDFDTAAEQLMSWQVQLRAGLDVAASSSTAQVGTVVLMGLGIGPLTIKIPCRVVYVITDQDRRGFAYGTLPGHPESGEEAFILNRDRTGRTHFTVTAFSRPATTLARLGGPLTTRMQRHMTRRYLGSLDQ